METDHDRRREDCPAGDVLLAFLAVVVDPTHGWPPPTDMAQPAMIPRLAQWAADRVALLGRALSQAVLARRIKGTSWKVEV